MIHLALLLAAADPCADAVTQAAMTRCAADAHAAADAAMTSRWRAVLAAMRRRDAAADAPRSPRYAAALLASQRAWLRFRDAQCALEGQEFAGGSLQPMTIARCKARLTADRTRQLEALDWTR